MADVYSNLENFNEILSHQQLIEENRELRLILQNIQIHLDEANAELKQLRKDYDLLNEDHKQLLINYSSLLKTARAEVERKADLMTNIHSGTDKLFLRFLRDKTNMAKGRERGRSKNKDLELPLRGKSGSADICDLKLKTQGLKDDLKLITQGLKDDLKSKTQGMKDDKEQLMERKKPEQQQKTKTEYRIPKLTNPKDELVVAKKETKSELKASRNVNEGTNEKENKDRKVKAASIFNRRKSMPVFRHEPFSSDEETESTSKLTAKSSSTKDQTDAPLDRYKHANDKPTEPLKQSEPPSEEHRHSDYKQPSSMSKSHSDERETSNDLRHKLTKNFNTREIHRSKEMCPIREDPHKHREYRGRSWERHEEEHKYRDNMQRRFDPRRGHIFDNRQSRKDAHDQRQNERGRRRVLDSPPPKNARHRVLETPSHTNPRQSPPTAKYARTKSRDRRSTYHQSDRPQLEQEYDIRPQMELDYDRRTQMEQEYDRRPQMEQEYDRRTQMQQEFDRRPQMEQEYNRRPQMEMEYDRRPQMEQENDRHRADQDPHPVKQKIREETAVERRSTNRQTDQPEQEIDKLKPGPAKHKIYSEEEEPETKRRRLDSKLSEGDHEKEGQKAVEVEALPRLICQSPDELIMENIHVDTPVKEATNTDATGLEDPRLTSKRYMQIVGDNNLIRLSTVTGRNVDLEVLAPYSTHIFESKDPTKKFEEYTEEDLVKNFYMNFDEDTNCSDTLESGEIDGGDVYSGLLIDVVPEKAMPAQKEQSTHALEPLTSDTPQISECGLLNPTSLEKRQISESEAPDSKLEATENPNKDEPSYLGAMTKKFRIPKTKPTEKQSEDNTVTAKNVPLNLTSETAPKNPLEFLLSQITQKCGVQSNIDNNREIEKVTVKSVNASSSTKNVVSEQTRDRISSHGSKEKQPEDLRVSENRRSIENAVVTKDAEKEKVLTKRLMVAGDLELSEDDNSDNIELHNSLLKVMEETKQLETKRQKARSKSRERPIEEKKTPDNLKGKETQKSSKFIELFGETSSLITPEDLELLTVPQVELQGDLVPSLEEEEVAVHVETFDKATRTETSAKPAKARTKSSKANKQDDTGDKKSTKQEKSKRQTDAKEKRKGDKKRTKKDEKVHAEIALDTAEITTVTPFIEVEPNVKTIIISTGIQSALEPTILDGAPMAGPQPVCPGSSKSDNAQTEESKPVTPVTTKTGDAHTRETNVADAPIAESQTVADNAELARSQPVVPGTTETDNAPIVATKTVITQEDNAQIVGSQPAVPKTSKTENRPIKATPRVIPDTTKVSPESTKVQIVHKHEQAKFDNTPIAVIAPMLSTNVRAFSQFTYEPTATSTPSRDITSDACKATPQLPESSANLTVQSNDCSASMHSMIASTSMQSTTLDSLSQSRDPDVPDLRIILKRRRRRVLKSCDRA